VTVLVLGGFLYQAYTLPEIYESDALVELANERGPDGPAVGSEALRAAVFDPRTLEQLALDTASHVQREGDKAATSVIDRARRSIELRPAGEARFTVAYRAATAALARRGCDSLVTTAAQRLVALRPTSSLSPQEEARHRGRVVEERTRELAGFVAQHPELAGKKNESGEAFLGVPGMRPPSTPAPAPTTDAVLPILLQQKTRLEERIAYVEKIELGGGEDNDKLPAGDSLARMDRASLQKMLMQVKAAIAARQAAADRARANAPSEGASEGATATDPAQSSAVQAEWQRLVQAVVDAQQQAAQGRDAAAGLHVVRAANTPSSPVLPNRRLLALLGVTVGLWAGLLWAFARVALGHVPVKPTQYLPEGLPAFPLEGELAEADLIVVPAETASAPRLADAAKALPPPKPLVATTPAPPKAAVSTTPVPPKAVAAATPSAAPTELTDTPMLDETDALPSFPMEADSAAAAEATAGRIASAKPVAAAPGIGKSTSTPAHPSPALAATVPAHVVEPPAAAATRGALPSFPMDAELAKAVDDATSATRAVPAKPAGDPTGLPKVIIAPEATVPAEPRSSSLPSFAIESEAASGVAGSAAVASSAPAAAATSATSVASAPNAGAAPPAVRVASSNAQKGLPVLAVDGARSTSGPPAERSPYAAVAEAARTSSFPPPPERVPAREPEPTAQRESRASWSPESTSASARSPSFHVPPRHAQADDGSIKPQPIAAVDGGRIEASPIMAIEEGMSTAASGKQGISVYPPPPVAPAPAPSPGGTMRLGSVSPVEPGSGPGIGSGYSGRRVTQTLGTPLGMSPSNAPTFGWTPHAGFGAHQMPPRESDPPPGLASIPPAPRTPSQIGLVPAPTSNVGSSRAAVQSLPLTPARHVAAVHVPVIPVEPPSTALALTRPRASRRSEPPAASSVVCDVPKGWAPHPSLVESETSEELAALRDQLYRLAGRECFVVGVSSGPEMAAYKSGVAARLAWMLAQPGHARVLLMEGDFDHPVVHRLMRIDMPLAAGFSEQMRRRMNGSSSSPWTIVRCAPTLYVLAEGLVRSPGLLPTVHFADSVGELRRAYDLIVIDGPAGGMSVDTRALDSVSDGIVLAGESDLLDRAASWFGKKQLMAVVSAGQTAPSSH